MVFFLYKISVINFVSSVDYSNGFGGIRQSTILVMCFTSSSDGKASVCNAGDLSSIPGLGDPLEKETASHSSFLAWRIHGQWILVGYSPQGHKESHMTVQLTHTSNLASSTKLKY